MRAPTFLVGFVQWRWTPSVVLVAGSLAFVGIVVLIVPDDFGGVTSGTDRVSRAARQGVAKKVEAPAGETTELVADEVPPPTFPGAVPGAPAPPANNIVQSIFHPTPKVELPVEPVDPNPPPPPEPPPAPPPTQTTFTLETQPAPPPTPDAVPGAAPEAPQGITGQ